MFVPEDARCCPDHMTNQRLKRAAINSIAPSSIECKKFSSNDIQLLISRWQALFERQKRLDFDNSEVFSGDEDQAFTSLSKDNLASQVSSSNIANSSNRSIRMAIAILLCKFRLGLSNNILTNYIVPVAG